MNNRYSKIAFSSIKDSGSTNIAFYPTNNIWSCLDADASPQISVYFKFEETVARIGTKGVSNEWMTEYRIEYNTLPYP